MDTWSPRVLFLFCFWQWDLVINSAESSTNVITSSQLCAVLYYEPWPTWWSTPKEWVLAQLEFWPIPGELAKFQAVGVLVAAFGLTNFNWTIEGAVWKIVSQTVTTSNQVQSMVFRYSNSLICWLSEYNNWQAVLRKWRILFIFSHSAPKKYIWCNMAKIHLSK